MLLKWGARVLSRTSPLALVAGGVILALSIPSVRRGLRSVAVTATAGVLSFWDSVTDAGDSLKGHMTDIIDEARSSTPFPADGLEATPIDIGPDANH